MPPADWISLRPALGMAFFVFGELFKDGRPLFILLGGGHRTVERDSVHLDEIVIVDNEQRLLG